MFSKFSMELYESTACGYRLYNRAYYYDCSRRSFIQYYITFKSHIIMGVPPYTDQVEEPVEQAEPATAGDPPAEEEQEEQESPSVAPELTEASRELDRMHDS
jgi:hypothetical protein